MLSFGTKINLILFLISVLVGLYLFVMQKEVRMMQNDITEMRTLVEKLMKSKFSAESCSVENVIGNVGSEACVIEPLVIFDDDYDDDDDGEDDGDNDLDSGDDILNSTSDDKVVSDSTKVLEEKQDQKVSEVDTDVDTILKTIDADDHLVKLSNTKPTKKRKTVAKK
jgi:hypothetical protein